MPISNRYLNLTHDGHTFVIQKAMCPGYTALWDPQSRVLMVDCKLQCRFVLFSLTMKFSDHHFQNHGLSWGR